MHSPRSTGGRAGSIRDCPRGGTRLGGRRLAPAGGRSSDFRRDNQWSRGWHSSRHGGWVEFRCLSHFHVGFAKGARKTRWGATDRVRHEMGTGRRIQSTAVRRRRQQSSCHRFVRAVGLSTYGRHECVPATTLFHHRAS